jgi:hypothetical protein
MNHAESVLAGDIAWIELLATVGFPSYRMTGGLAVITRVPSNTDNGLVIDPALVDRHELRGAVRWLRASGVPASCILSERPEPDLVADLERLGLTADNDANAMGRSLLDYAPPVPTVSGYDVTEVLTMQDLCEGLAALGDEWYDERARRLRERVDAAVGFGTDARVRHWVARASGRAVAMATSFRFGDVVALASCGVQPAHRRRGVARALTGARLRAAITDGATSAVLSPSHDGYLLHRQLGFELVPVLADRWFHIRTAPADGEPTA